MKQIGLAALPLIQTTLPFRSTEQACEAIRSADSANTRGRDESCRNAAEMNVLV